MPKILFEVASYDSWKRYRTEGYTWTQISSKPGIDSLLNNNIFLTYFQLNMKKRSLPRDVELLETKRRFSIVRAEKIFHRRLARVGRHYICSHSFESRCTFHLVQFDLNKT